MTAFCERVVHAVYRMYSILNNLSVFNFIYFLFVLVVSIEFWF